VQAARAEAESGDRDVAESVTSNGDGSNGGEPVQVVEEAPADRDPAGAERSRD
jgi:hypothetical protein